MIFFGIYSTEVGYKLVYGKISEKYNESYSLMIWTLGLWCDNVKAIYLSVTISYFIHTWSTWLFTIITFKTWCSLSSFADALTKASFKHNFFFVSGLDFNLSVHFWGACLGYQSQIFWILNCIVSLMYIL